MDKHITVDFDGYQITTDKAMMHPVQIHKWLSEESYWSKYIPYDLFYTGFTHSFAIGAILGNEQVAYAKLVTDYATYGYLADVFVTEPHRGKGVSKKMMEILFGLDWVMGLRRLMLATKDAHELYRKVGFKAGNFPDRIMEIARPNIYGDQSTRC